MLKRFFGGTSKNWRGRALCRIPAVFVILFLMFTQIYAQDYNQSPSKASRYPKVGLALGGGGARGMAHIGVIMALEEEGIPIDMIAGTSAGSIIGGLYAAGYSGTEIREIIMAIDWKYVFSEAPFPRALWISQRYGLRQPLFEVHFAFWKIFLPRGLINGQHISEELFRLTTEADYAARSNFDNLAVPFRSVAVDISTGRLYALEKGNLAQAIRASSAIPGYYFPAIFDDKLMVDGGILNMIPVDVTKEMGADVGIAVRVNQTLAQRKKPKNLIDMLENTLDIMLAELGKKHMELADVIIEPDLGTHSPLDFSGIDSIIEKGYVAAKHKMGEIKKLVKERIDHKVLSNRMLDANALDRAKVSNIRVIDHTFSPGETGESKKTGEKKPPKTTNFSSQKLILSYFPITQEKEFNIERALKGVEDLYATGLFQNVWLELDNPGNGNVEVNVHCIEESNRSIGFGGNFRNEEGLSGFIQIIPFNLFGVGDHIMPLFRYGRLQMTAGLEISVGRFLLSSFSLDTGLYYEKEKPYLYSDIGENLGQLDIDKALAKVSFGYQPSKNFFFALGFRGERIRMMNNPLPEFNEGSLNCLTVFSRAIYDNIDDMYFPTQGIQLILDHETVLSTSSQGRYFTKFSGSFNWTHSLFRKQTITPLAKWGFSVNSLPVYEKFRVGGPMDMPGFHRNEVWGNNVIIFGLKHRIPLYKSFGLQTTLSVASVFDQVKSLEADKFITGISTGLAFPSPVGPICLQYGWSGTGRNQFYLSVGYDF
jgi:NTE family protein